MPDRVARLHPLHNVTGCILDLEKGRGKEICYWFCLNKCVISIECTYTDALVIMAERGKLYCLSRNTWCV